MRKNGVLVMLAVVTAAGGMAFGQNLLVNGSFEDSPDLVGWNKATWYSTNWGELPPNITKRTGWGTFTGTGVPFEGAYLAGTDRSGQANFHVGMYQTFNTTAGQLYEVTGGYMGGVENSSDTAWWEVRVVPGTSTNPDDPGVIIAKKERLPNGGWIQFRETFSNTFTASATTATIFLKWGRVSSSSYVAECGGWDNLAVVAAGGCPDQHTVTGISPLDGPNSGPITLTATGTNLQFATAMKLKRDATTIVGTNLQHPNNETLTADFDLNNLPLGKYDVVVEHQTCASIILIQAFTVTCAGGPASTVSTIVNDRGKQGDRHTLRLTGTSLSSLTGVALKKSRFNTNLIIQGTNLTPVGNDLEVTFDLSGAEGGRYDVLYTHACGQVTPTRHDKAFLVYMPEITNGSFEEGWTLDADTTPVCDGGINRPAPKHWDEFRWDFEGHQGAIKRDASVDGPACDGGLVKNITGEHYAGFDSNAYSPNSGFISFFQTVDATPYLTAGALTQDLVVRAEFDVSQPSAKGYIRLIGDTEVDGDDNGVAIDPAVLAMTEILPSEENGFISDESYKAVIPAGTVWPTTNPPLLTIEFRFYKSPPACGAATWTTCTPAATSRWVAAAGSSGPTPPWTTPWTWTTSPSCSAASPPAASTRSRSPASASAWIATSTSGSPSRTWFSS